MKNYLLLALVASLMSWPVTLWAADTKAPPAPQGGEDAGRKGALTLARRTKAKPLGAREVRVVYRKDDAPALGLVLFGKEGVSWVPEQAAPVKLPHKLDTLVAASGRAMLQYGDSTSRQHPAKIDLYFFDALGVEKGRVLDHYGPLTNVAMADDGHVAVAGPLLADAKQNEIGLYTAAGAQRFQVQLPAGRRSNIAVPAPQGQRVAVFSTDSEDSLANHRLEILDGSGKKIAEKEGLGILQKAVAVANGTMFFVQAKQRFGMVNASDGSLLWTRDGVLRLISPYGAVTDPQGKTLFLAAAEWDGLSKARYTWRIEVRDVATGEELARFLLPDTYPSTEGRVFINVSGEQIELLAGDERIVLDLKRP